MIEYIRNRFGNLLARKELNRRPEEQLPILPSPDIDYFFKVYQEASKLPGYRFHHHSLWVPTVYLGTQDSREAYKDNDGEELFSFEGAILKALGHPEGKIKRYTQEKRTELLAKAFGFSVMQASLLKYIADTKIGSYDGERTTTHEFEEKDITEVATAPHMLLGQKSIPLLFRGDGRFDIDGMIDSMSRVHWSALTNYYGEHPEVAPYLKDRKSELLKRLGIIEYAPLVSQAGWIDTLVYNSAREATIISYLNYNGTDFTSERYHSHTIHPVAYEYVPLAALEVLHSEELKQDWEFSFTTYCFGLSHDNVIGASTGQTVKLKSANEMIE